MGFSTKDRDEAMVRSARRCCVCRRYNGVGVEVHHIVQPKDGGPDTLDNAIVLCFDCHMAAGHYNADHPRGTKFKPSELRRLRDDWIQRVRDSGIASMDQEFHDYYSRHLVSTDRAAARDCLDLNRKDLPFTISYLHKNAVTGFMSWVLKDGQYPDGSAPPRLIESTTDLSAVLSTLVDGDEPSIDGYSYYREPEKYYESEAEFHDSNSDMEGQLERPLSADDFADSKLESVFLRQAFEEGYDVTKLGKVIGNYDPCGGGCWEKIYIARKQLFVFSEIRNTGTDPITISAVQILESGQDLNLGLRELRTDITTMAQESVPDVRLEPSESLIVPEMVLLSPKSGISVDAVWENEIQNTTDGRAQLLGYYLGSANCDDYLIAGPRRSLIGCELRKNGKVHAVSIHDFEPTNTYLFYRFWEMGSCPHLFFRLRDDGWHHVGEILSDAFAHRSAETVDIPDGVDRVMIAELEFETTTINSIVDGEITVVDGPLCLERGDSIEIAVSPGARLTITGSYRSRIEKQQGYDDIWLKTALVGDHLAALNRTTSNQQ